jgi:hypothetical protein
MLLFFLTAYGIKKKILRITFEVFRVRGGQVMRCMCVCVYVCVVMCVCVCII